MSDDTPKDDKSAELAALQESIARLEAKNRELIAENRAAKGVKPEDLTAAEDRAERAEAKLAELERSNKTLAKQAETATKQLTELTESSKAAARAEVLARAAAKNGVLPELTEAYIALREKHAVTEFKDGQWVTHFGDGKDADTWIAEDLASDKGKHFKAAAMNSGGGAPGGAGKGGSGKTVTTDAFEAMTPKERHAFFANGGEFEKLPA